MYEKEKKHCFCNQILRFYIFLKQSNVNKDGVVQWKLGRMQAKAEKQKGIEMRKT